MRYTVVNYDNVGDIPYPGNITFFQLLQCGNSIKNEKKEGRKKKRKENIAYLHIYTLIAFVLKIIEK